MSRSDDQGASWREIFNIGTGRTLRGVDFVDRATGWVVGTRTIFHTRTGGRGGEWEDQTANIEGDPVVLLDVAFLDRARGVAGGLGIGPNGGTGAIVLVTSDGGAHWRRRTVGRPQTAVTRLCLSPNGAGAAVGEALLRAVGVFLLTTDDGGESWTDVTDAVREAAGSPFVLVNCEHLPPSTLWVVGEDSLLVESVDGGATWTRREVTDRPDAILNAVRFVDRETGWISGSDGDTGEVVIFRTDDAGATWDEQVVDGASVLTALPAAAFTVLGSGVILFVGDDPATFTQGSRALSFVSRDGGATWTASAIPDGYRTFQDVDAVP